MTVQTYARKSELPSGQDFEADDLTLFYVGYRKRKAERKSFSGMNLEECIIEARAYRKAHGGKYVPHPNNPDDLGSLSSCTLNWHSYEGEERVLWKRALMMRPGFAVSRATFSAVNRDEV